MQITRLGICFPACKPNQQFFFSAVYAAPPARRLVCGCRAQCFAFKMPMQNFARRQIFLLPLAHYAARRPPIIYGGNSGNGKLDVDLYLVWFGPAFWQSMCFYMCAYEMGYWILRAGHCESLSFFARKMIRPSLKKTIEKAFYLLSI